MSTLLFTLVFTVSGVSYTPYTNISLGYGKRAFGPIRGLVLRATLRKVNIMFHIGQLVVCINDTWKSHLKNTEGISMPTKGMIYTIRGLPDCPGDREGHGYGVHLEEIINPVKLYTWGKMEAVYDPSRFRPVRKTSIDCFTEILNKTPKLEDA